MSTLNLMTDKLTNGIINVIVDLDNKKYLTRFIDKATMKYYLHINTKKSC